METSTSPTADLVVDFESVVRFLRAQGVDDQLTILEAVHSAVNEAEDVCNRTLRKSVTRTIYYRGWDQFLAIPYPPLQSITSVKYYNLSDTLTTMSASDYAVHTPTRGVGRVVWQSDYNFPNVNTDRPDPIQIVAVTGWGSSDTIPAKAKTAIRMLVEAIHDRGSDIRTEAFRVLQSLVYRGRP